MWDLVGNPEDRFSHNEAQFTLKVIKRVQLAEKVTKNLRIRVLTHQKKKKKKKKTPRFFFCFFFCMLFFEVLPFSVKLAVSVNSKTSKKSMQKKSRRFFGVSRPLYPNHMHILRP